MEKCHQENKNNSYIIRRKHYEPNSVERAKKFGVTSKADPGKVPLRYSKIPLQKSLQKPKQKKTGQNTLGM